MHTRAHWTSTLWLLELGCFFLLFPSFSPSRGPGSWVLVRRLILHSAQVQYSVPGGRGYVHVFTKPQHLKMWRYFRPLAYIMMLWKHDTGSRSTLTIGHRHRALGSPPLLRMSGSTDLERYGIMAMRPYRQSSNSLPVITDYHTYRLTLQPNPQSPFRLLYPLRRTNKAAEGTCYDSDSRYHNTSTIILTAHILQLAHWPIDQSEQISTRITRQIAPARYQWMMHSPNAGTTGNLPINYVKKE